MLLGACTPGRNYKSDQQATAGAGGTAGATPGGGRAGKTSGGAAGSPTSGTGGTDNPVGAGGTPSSSGATGGMSGAGEGGASAGAEAGASSNPGGSGGDAGSPGCSDACTLSDTACAEGSLKTCELGTSGCTEWSKATGCDTGACADTHACLVCDDQCTSGDTQCSGGNVTACTADQYGCLDWSGAQACGSGFCGSSQSCGACDDKCTAGDQVCTSGQLRQCSPDSDGCLDLGTPTACPSGFCANASTCGVCSNACDLGQYTCSGATLTACAADTNGCRAFTGTQTTCSGDTPVCDAAGGKCKCTVSPNHCQNATTALACTAGSVTTVPCAGNTPVCVDGSGCVACTEHSQCPGSACHLSGAKQGTCFAAGTVTSVSNVSQLQSAISALGDGAEKVIRITAAGIYSLTSQLSLPTSAEVAVIGATSGITVSNGFTAGDARNSVFGTKSGDVYVANLTFSGSSAISALSVASGTIAWFDDVKVYGYYNALSTGSAEVHARRSWFRSNGLPVYIAGTLYMENTVVGPSVDTSGNPIDGLQLAGGITVQIDLRYVSILGNYAAIDCTSAGPPPAGVVRNSILASYAGNSIIGGTNGSNCSTIQFANDAVDQTGYGTTIAWYNAAWFTAPASGNFHLTTSGKSAIPKVAGAGSDDPKVDIDGQARPASSGYPGIDEP